MDRRVETNNPAITKRIFFSILNYGCRRRHLILPLFYQISDVCDYLNIRLSLCEGSLLGCIRHERMIYWDDDIDLCLSKENIKHLIQAAPNLLFIQNNDNFYFCRDRKTNKTIDIFTPNFRDNLYVCQKYVLKHFEGRSIYIPYNYIDILDIRYKNWIDTCYISNHKLSKEQFNRPIGYDESLMDRYYKLNINTAKSWISEWKKNYGKK